MKTEKPDQHYIDMWNEASKKAIRIDPDTRNRTMVRFCEKLLLRAKQAYYDGHPIMSDGMFDRIEESLRILKPDSPVLQQVGSKDK